MNITSDRNERKTDEPRRVESHLPNNAEPTAQEGHQFIDIHIYHEGPTDEETQNLDETIGTIEATPQPARRRVISSLQLVLLAAIILLVIGGGSLVYPLLFVQSETVTIIPTTKKVQTSATLIISTGAPVPDSVPGRVLTSLTMSQTLTVATTGETYQSAESGQGTITFYNSALYPQTIIAGTLITGKDGTQVVTDSAVTVPAGTLVTNGQATVIAHTVITGYSSNITANDIYGPCCLVNIEAANGAFSGGIPATTYQSVAQQDIDRAFAQLQTTLTRSVVAALSTQVQSSETLVTPPMCQPTITTDHHVGDKATQVQVSVSETCNGLTYNTQAFQQRISRIQLVAHYRMVGTPQVAITSVTSGNGSGTYTLTIQSTAVWVYQFTQRELSTIATHIAGNSTSQARTLLLHISGVRQVSFNASGNLPMDSSKIHFLFLTQP